MNHAIGLSLQKTRRILYPYLWFIPAFAILLSMLIYPWLWTFRLSFFAWSPIRMMPARFIGLSNYVKILTSQEFRTALGNTVSLMIMRVSLEFLIGFGLALLLNLRLRGVAFFRTICLIPMMLTPSIVGLVWKVLFHDELGLINWALDEMGLNRVGWLSNPSLTLLTVTIVCVWQNASFVMLVLLAGLQTIPNELIEAARVDGATVLQQFRHITLPWLKPLIAIVLLFRLMFALRTFDVIYSLFRSSGPANAAMVFGVYLYENLRVSWDLGMASAISYVILGITIFFSLWFAIIMARR